jgi:uncharacterized membrane protein
MKARTGNQSIIAVIAASIACFVFVYAVSMRVQDAAGHVDPKESVLSPTNG